MKKFIGLLLVVGLSTAFCACSKDEPTDLKLEDEQEVEDESVNFKASDEQENEDESANLVATDEQDVEDEPTNLEIADAHEAEDASTIDANVDNENVVETPGEDIVVIVNLKGDETTVYKLVDGTYMDRIDRKFTYNGTDTWFDEDGVEWNEKT